MRIKEQIGPVLGLAGPLILAELGWMTMGIVDTIMVGHMDRPVLAIGAVALGGVLYNTIGFGIAGILLGLDTYLSQAHGAGEYQDAGRWLLHGLVLAAGLAGILGALVWVAPSLLLRLPMDRDVLVGAGSFLRALNWGTPALFLYFVLRRYLQAFNHVRSIAMALVSANLLNLFIDWLLIYGHAWGRFSVAAMGVYGAGLSTSLSRLYLAGFMVWMVLRVNRRNDYGLKTMTRRFEKARVWRLARLGAPAGGQIFVEISIFGMVTFLIGAMGALPLAGHEIALNCASFTFMIPFAISSATTVRVGQGIGRKAPQEAKAAGWAGILLGAAAMGVMALALSSGARLIAGGFTRDSGVIGAAVPLLYVAAVFQFFDGLQITATGALRGVGNTHAGLVVQLVGYWVIGLPVGWWLGFRMGWGALGLWVGLCTGLVVAGVALTAVWARAMPVLAPEE